MYLSIILLIYLGGASFYMLFFAVVAKIPTPKKSAKIGNQSKKIAVFIPAYKEDAVIVDVAKKALAQSYPVEAYDVIILADSLQANTLVALSKLPIKVIEVRFEKSTKAKALNEAFRVLPNHQYDLALILDADNVMERDFLAHINQAFEHNVKVVQGRRIAKNQNSSYAILDAVSEAINYSIYNLGHQKVGLSARLVGSGMAFDYQLLKETMQTVDAVGGFDKELELKFIEKNIHIEYLHDALVYDEKVSKAAVFTRQRKRWISAQFHYCRLYFPKALWGLLTKGQLDFFNKAYQMTLPPRLLLPGFLLLGMLLNYWAYPALFIYWTLAFVANVLANVLALPLQFFNMKTLVALSKIPKAFLSMCLVLFQLKNANQQFIHTPHGSHAAE
jgi:cellulose synthase/poly-beta-1,6-N-acetylglucosamine synthase-like glycosyltransferase